MPTTQDLAYRVSVNDQALDGLTRKITQLNAALYSSVAATKPLDAQLRAFGRRTAEVGRYMTRNLTTPILLLGAASLRSSVQFEKSMGTLASLTDTGAEATANFRKQLLDTNNVMLRGNAPKALADALYFIRSSGISTAKSMEVLNTSAQAAFAGLGELKNVADATTSAMNAYGQSTNKASYYTDVLTATVREGKAEPNELASSIGRVIPLAAQMGVTFAEVGGSIAAMTQQGLSADLAVTGLRAILSTFTRALKPTTNALQGMGFTLEDVNKSIDEQGLAPTLQTIRREVDKFDSSAGQLDGQLVKAAKLGGFDDAVEQLQGYLGTTSDTLLSKLFPNIRALTAFLILTSKHGTVTAKVMREVQESMGDTAAAAAKRAETDIGRYEIAVTNLSKRWTEFGGRFIPIATKIINFGEKILGAFNKLPDSLRNFAVASLVIVAALGPVLQMIGNISRVWSVFAIKAIRDDAKIVGSVRTVQAATEQAGIASVQASRMSTAVLERYEAELITTTAAVENLTRAERIRAGIPFIGGRAGAGGGVLGGGGRKAAGEVVRTESRLKRFIGTVGGAALSLVTLGGRLGRLGSLFGRVGGILAKFGRFAGPTALVTASIYLLSNWKQTVGWMVKANQELNKLIAKTPGGGALQRLAGHIPYVGGLFQPADESGVGAAAKLSRKQILQLAIDNKKMESIGMDRKNILLELEATIGGKRGTEFAKKAYGGQIGSAIRESTQHTLAELEAMMRALDTKGQKRFADIAHNAVKAFKDTMAKDLKRLKVLQDLFGDSFGRFTSDVQQAFDAHTDALAAKLKYTVTVAAKGIKETFRLIGPDALTPAEQALVAFDERITARSLRENLTNAKTALAEVRQKGKDAIAEANKSARDARGRSGEFQMGRYFYQFAHVGDPEALKRANKAAADAKKQAAADTKTAQTTIRDAEEAILRDSLARRATIERTAATLAYTEAEKQFLARRALTSRHMNDELAIVQTMLAEGKITVDQAQKQITAILQKAGVDWHTAGVEIGTAFVTGITESYNAMLAMATKIEGVLGRIVRAKAGIADAKLMEETRKQREAFTAAGLNPPYRPDYRPGAVPPVTRPVKQKPVTGADVLTGIGFQPKSTVTIENQHVYNDTDAAAAANKTARATNRR